MIMRIKVFLLLVDDLSQQLFQEHSALDHPAPNHAAQSIQSQGPLITKSKNKNQNHIAAKDATRNILARITYTSVVFARAQDRSSQNLDTQVHLSTKRGS
jgi:hypothetical protein